MSLEQKLPHAPNFERFLAERGVLEVETQGSFCPYIPPSVTSILGKKRRFGYGELYEEIISAEISEIIKQHKNIRQEKYLVKINEEEIGTYGVFFNNDVLTGAYFEEKNPGYLIPNSNQKIELHVVTELVPKMQWNTWDPLVGPGLARKDPYTLIPFM